MYGASVKEILDETQPKFDDTLIKGNLKLYIVDIELKTHD